MKTKLTSKTAAFLAAQNNTIDMPLFKQLLSISSLAADAAQWRYCIGDDKAAEFLIIHSAMLRRSAVELLEGAGDAH